MSLRDLDKHTVIMSRKVQSAAKTDFLISKDKMRLKLQEDVAEYLRNGGVIEVVDCYTRAVPDSNYTLLDFRSRKA